MSGSIDALTDLGLFTGQPQFDNFCRFAQLLPSKTMAASSRPRPFATGDVVEIPETFLFDGVEHASERLLADTHTAALYLLKDGRVRLERYFLTGGADVPWISWSVAKSFVSALIGIAVSEGHIGGLDDPMADYIRVPAKSAYANVRIKDVLQMSSGARWHEDYNDPGSDVFRLGAAMAGAMTLDDFVATMAPELPPGTLCRYNSGDTQALGALLVGATRRSLTDYMQEKLCEPLGFEDPSYWLVDSAGMEMAFAGLNITARDFAKLGELYRNFGRVDGNQLVPAPWVRASLHADAPHLQPGKPMVGDRVFGPGYGFQWWLPAGNRQVFTALGVYNQFVYVDPSRGTVIVKLSANPSYGTSTGEKTNRDMENLAFLEALSAASG